MKVPKVVESFRRYVAELHHQQSWASIPISDDPNRSKKAFKRLYAAIGATTNSLGWKKELRLKDGERLFALGKCVNRTLRTGNDLSMGEVFALISYWKAEEFQQAFIQYVEAYRILNSEEDSNESG